MLFVVGNVSAAEVKLTDTDVKYGEVNDDSFKANATYVNTSKYTSSVKPSSNPLNKDVTIKVSEASLNFIEKGSKGFTPYDAAWVGFHIDALTVENTDWKSDAEVTGTWAVNGESKGKVEDDGWYVIAITQERLQEAVKNGGTLTFNFVFTWNVEGEKDDDTAKGTFEQTVTVKIDAMKLTVTDAREDSEDKDDAEKIMWAPSIAKAYQAQLPATTPAEETTATEESGKDSQPKTGEEIPMALVGMMTLGLAGAYTFKKSNVFRRRQRLCRRNSYC